MRTIILLLFSALLFTGCGMLKGTTAGDNSSAAEKKSAGKISVGDTVVAKWSTGSFYEGKVERMDGAKVTVAWLDKSKASDVDAVDVYAMPATGAKSDAKPGDMVLAKTASSGTYWNGAEVAAIEGDVIKVRPVSGTTTVNLAPEKVIKVAAATAADFKEKAGATDFLKEAQNGKPTVPAGYKPKKGDAVVAEWSRNSWYSGKIDNISGLNIYVAWDDNTKPSAVSADKVIPKPTNDNKDLPTENQFLLIKPESGAKWQYAQAASISGGTVEAKLPDGKTRTLKLSEFILLN